MIVGLAFFVFLPASGCSFFGPEAELEVIAPELPGGLSAALGRSGLEASGRIISRDLTGGKQSVVCAPGAAGTVRLPKRPGRALLYEFGVPGTGLRVRPAGAVFPVGLDGGGSLRLRWRDGPAAELLLAAEAGGVDTSRLNTGRLVKEISERIDGSTWRLDRALLSKTLEAGEMKAYRIREKEDFEISLLLPEGIWLPLDPMAETIEAGPESGIPADPAPWPELWKGAVYEMEMELSAGYHSWIRSDGRFFAACTIGEREKPPVFLKQAGS
ncbi:MAG: hypothetical protein K9L68_02110 [Spirochaetales bacterium]|nr:hypothetical protein [Spirochaetales bacterium]MCF7937373.1 hypothetical protein [Spirochaetales bacterium]